VVGVRGKRALASAMDYIERGERLPILFLAKEHTVE